MPAKIIFDSKSEIPAHLQSDAKEVEGKWELDAQGVLNKNKELLGKNATLSTTNEELEAKVETLKSSVLSKGQIAVNQKEFDALKTENESYKALGGLDDIKPKLEKYDEVIGRDEARTRADNYRAVAKKSGFANEEGFIKLAEIEKIEPVLKTVNEGGKAIEKYFVKTKNAEGKEVETAITDYVKESPTFSPFVDSLTATQSEGKKMFKQSANGGNTANLETEIAAQKQTGIYGL